ncbi:unnamed protein product [Euphydryas editha]|uniref:Endonuclease-reverse transcriptase n=1 Tax=Euphydryas editha TaxID=104508 RepID=A0AAU9TM11_EUPED|nr:unnamed protein product [Euphydryas editha]
MDEVLKALEAIKKDLDNQRQEIREMGNNVTEKVTQNISRMFEEKFLTLEKNHENLKEVVENQEKRIHAIERQARKNNLIFFGIEESEKSYNNLERNFIIWTEQYLSLKISHNDIKEIKRIGKKDEKLRPIVVTFTTLGSYLVSMSPENDTETNLEKNTQINKKNKTQQIVASAKRSSSFSEGITKQGILNYVVKNTTNKTNNQNNQA